MVYKVSTLPDNAVVFYIMQMTDYTGAAYIPQHLIDRLSQVSSVPIYGLWDPLLGHGIVGGHLSSAAAAGKAAFDTCMKILNGKSPGDVGVNQGTNVYMFDWAQLKKWRLDRNKLPEGSNVLNKKRSFWGMYRGRIITIAVFILLETLLIVYLLVQRAHRMTAEKLLREHRDALERTVRKRTKDLNIKHETLQKETAQRRQVESDKERLIEELKDALLNVKTLVGLLPVCSKCNKVRDDKGYWDQIEQYIRQHSDTLFSHGLCPACFEELYGKELWYKEAFPPKTDDAD